MNIIPAIDLIDGKCVRLIKGDFSKQKSYEKDPVELAIELEQYGFEYLHIVDLAGALDNKLKHINILKEICNQTILKVDFGGGIRTSNDVDRILDAGAHQLTIGSLAIKDSKICTQLIETYGAERFIIAADFHQSKIVYNAWKDQSEIGLNDFIDYYAKLNIRDFLCTDIQKDGMLEGPSFKAYESILKNHRINVIASGGISSTGDLRQLKSIGCSSAIVGKAMYEEKISLKELQNFEAC